MAQLKDKVGNFFAWALKSKEPVSVDVTRRDDPEAKSEVSIQQLKQGYGEVMETMQSVRTHLEQQADRSERMLEMLDHLPQALQAIPENARTQTAALEAIQSHLQDQNHTSRQLTEAITGLATASAHQQRTLSGIDTHLAKGNKSRTQLNDGVAALTDTLGDVKQSNAATRESINAVVDQARAHDEQMREMVQRSHKMNTMMVILCLALASGALALGGYVAVMVNRMISEPTPAETVGVAPSAAPTEAEALPLVVAPGDARNSTAPLLSSSAYRVTAPESTGHTDESAETIGLEPMGPPIPAP